MQPAIVVHNIVRKANQSKPASGLSSFASTDQPDDQLEISGTEIDSTSIQRTSLLTSSKEMMPPVDTFCNVINCDKAASR